MTSRRVLWAAARIDRVASVVGLAGRERPGVRVARFAARRIQEQRPDPVQEPVDAADAAGAPRAALVPRTHEHEEQADRVGAVALDQLVRVLDVPARLAHPLAIGAQDLALVEQAEERLTVTDEVHVGHRLGEEAAVHQVHDRVLRAAGVLVHGGPAIGHRAVDRSVRLLGREVAEPVPRRIHERVHRVGLAPGRTVALRARRGQECLVVVERVVAAALVVDRLGQADRQLVIGDRDDAVALAVDDRDRRPPVALPAEQPVA